jgi:hypothetical protein
VTPAESRIVAILQHDPVLKRALPALAALGLPDAWIGAGAVRNPVFDHLHGLPPRPLADIDVAWFDPADASVERDMAIEAALRETVPDLPWSVHNQARMHARNGHAPYAGAVHAIGHWVETVTAVGVRLGPDGEIEIAAPHGLDDLVDLVLRPVPAYRDKIEVFRSRIREKGWLARWPRLTISE